MKRIFALGLVPILLSACHLYIEDDPEPADPDAAVVPEQDAARPDGCVDPASVRAELNACFDFAQFDALGLCQIPNLGTNMGACSSCHASGGDGIQLNPDCELTLLGFSIQENFEDLAIIEEVDGCVSTVTVGKICSSELIGGAIHPPFVCPNSIRDGLQQFLDEALAGARAGTCE